ARCRTRGDAVKTLIVTILTIAPLLAAEDAWKAAIDKLTPGNRVEIIHLGKLYRGIYAFANPAEIVITTSKDVTVAIPPAEVERLTMVGTDDPKLGFFSNANDQLFPDRKTIFDHTGAAVSEKKKHREKR